MSFNVSVEYKDQSDFFITPSPAATDFSGNKLELAKIPKLNQVAADLTTPSNPDLFWTGARLEQINQYGENNKLTCVWDTITSENFASYSPVFKNNNAAIVSGYADMTAGITNFENDFFVGKPDVTIEFTVKAVAAGGGTNDIFHLGESTTQKYIKIFEQSDRIKVRARVSNGDYYDLEFNLPSPYIGVDIPITVEYKDFDGVNNGFIRLYINGILGGRELTTTSSIVSGNYTFMRFDGQSKFHVKNFMYQEGIKYDSDFTYSETLPANPFIESSENILSGTYEAVGDVTDYVTLTAGNNQNARFTVNGQWYNGASWVASNGSYTQATEASAMDLSLLAVNDNDYSVDLVFPDSSTQGYLEAAQFDFNGEAFESAISATTNASFPVTSFNSFVSSYYVPSDYTGVGFTFLIGSISYYFNVNSQSWQQSDNSINQINTPEQLTESVLALLNVPGLFKLTTFLYSLNDPSLGHQGLESPSITLASIDFNYTIPSLAPPSECLLYGLDRTVCTDPAVDSETIEYYMVIDNPKTFFHGNTIVRKSTCRIEVTGPAAVQAHAFYETETISGVDGDYKYRFGMETVRISTDARGNENRSSSIDWLGYAIVPNQNEYLIGDLVYSDTPGINS